jgi:glucosamine-6-phosphate deaminase
MSEGPLHSPDGAEVIIVEDPVLMAESAAARAAGLLRDAVDRHGVANAMFATGNSQLAFIDALVDPSHHVPWGDVVVFHMDEYVGIGPDHPASFERWIRMRIVDRTHPRAAHYLHGTADPDDECRRYADLLAAHPLDLCCLGIGENGHLAFNDPGVADFDEPLDVKIVEIDADCRRQQVGEGHFASEGDVPRQAMTVTVPALLRADRVIAVVPDARKAVPVRDALRGPVSEECPASALQRVPHATVFLDTFSAALL